MPQEFKESKKLEPHSPTQFSILPNKPLTNPSCFSGSHSTRNKVLTLGATALVLEGLLATATFWFAKDAMEKALGVNIGGWEPSRGEATMVGVAVLISIAALAVWTANRSPKNTDNDDNSCLDKCFTGFRTGFGYRETSA